MFSRLERFSLVRPLYKHGMERVKEGISSFVSVLHALFGLVFSSSQAYTSSVIEKGESALGRL